MSQNHLIQRLTVEVSAADPATARQRQDELSRWVRSESLLNRISERLDQIVADDVVWRIPKIEIEVSGADEASFHKNLIETLVKKISQSVQGQADKKAISKQSHLQETIFFYLVNGFLPASVSQTTKQEIQAFFKAQTTRLDEHFWQEIQRQAAENPQIISQLMAQFSLQKARLIFCQILHLSTDLIHWIELFLKTQTIETKGQSFQKNVEITLWQAVFSNPNASFLASKAVFEEYFEKEISIAKLKIKAPPKNDSQATREENESIVEDGFYVENAGLVLLAPFFSQLFQALGWTDAHHQWKAEVYQNHAVGLLAYLSHGLTETFEYDWVLNKHLCGLPVETVIAANEPLAPTTLAAADELLKAVVGYWSVLKSTSPDGLRHTFLQRQGKLSPKSEGDGWRLLVERKTEDVLIERIPWGFSVIKLPWMNDILFVEW
jgi:hypothetical protein